jgi:hypothetical protein
MARDGHLDPDVLEIFLETEIWKRYAEDTLAAEQRDEVDLEAVRGLYRPAAARG